MRRFHRLSYFILLFAVLSVSMMALQGCSESIRAAKTWEGAFPNDPNDPTSNRPSEIEITRVTPLKQNFQQLPPVKVAILLPLSGKSAGLGNSMLQASQMALFEMGYDQFELMPRDTGGTAAGASNAAQSAIQNGAQLILGPVFADSVRAVKAVAAPHNINIVAFSTDWTLAGQNTFLMGFMPFAQVERVARFSMEQGHKNFGLIAPIDKYGDAVSKSFKQSVMSQGGSIARELRYIPRKNDLSEQIETFAKSAAEIDSVFIPVGGSTLETIAGNLSYNGLTPQNIKRMGTGLWEDPKLARDRNLSGGIFAGPSPRLYSEFQRRYQNLYNQKPVRLASLAYDATALAAVLAKTGHAKMGKPGFDKNALMDANGFVGTDGIFRFRPNGLVERGLSILEFRQGKIVEVDPAPSTFQ